jgi:hypothetical protein
MLPAALGRGVYWFEQEFPFTGLRQEIINWLVQPSSAICP